MGITIRIEKTTIIKKHLQYFCDNLIDQTYKICDNIKDLSIMINKTEKIVIYYIDNCAKIW